jgi:transposase, IS5 family
MSQPSFASAEYTMKKKLTRREKFLGGMRIVPWSRLIAVIEPLYPKSGRVGRQPIGNQDAAHALPSAVVRPGR